MNLEKFQEYLKSEEYQRYIDTRFELLRGAELSYEARVYLYREFQKNIYKWIEICGWVYEPRNIQEPDIVYSPFDYQADLIYRLEKTFYDGDVLYVEKSRDLGVTWTIVHWLVYHWLFTEKFSALIGSRKEAEVDNKMISCYDKDTEILTNNGWKYFWELDVEKDLVATRNPKTFRFEWQQPLKLVVSDYSGEMYHIFSRTLDLLVTPNHRILYVVNPWEKIKDGKVPQEKIATAEELFKMSPNTLKTIPAFSRWEGKEIEKIIFKEAENPKPKIYYRKDGYFHSIYWTKPKKEVSMNGDDFCAFMGMYLSEGSVGGKTICISQSSKSKGFFPYKSLLIKILGREPFYGKSGAWRFTNKYLASYLKKFGKSYEKYIPEEIMNATPRQIALFLYYYILGDGCVNKKNQISCFTTSSKMADQLQELFQKVGFSASIRKEITKGGKIGNREILGKHLGYRVYVRKSNYQTFQMEKVFYEGKIWCVSTKNGIVYVRRNGYPAWCGNSIFGKARYLIYAQPKWLFPKNFKKKFHDNHMKLINPENGSVLYGESANPNFGRGARTSLVFLDEVAYWQYLEESLRSCQDTSRVKIYVSTPTENQFLKRFVDNLREQNKVLTLHWKQHPFKDEEWYKKEFELRKEDPLSFLSELELSYDVDPKLRYYPEAYDCQIETIEFDPKLPLYASADFAGFQDYTALSWYQYEPYKNEIRNLTAIASHGRLMPNKLLIDWWLSFLNPDIPYDKMWYNEYERELLERIRGWGKPKIVFGEPAHRQVSQVAGYSFETILRKNGVNFLIVNIGTSHEIRKRAVQKYLKITKFNNDSGSLRLLDALKSSKISERSLRGTTEGKIVPLHISPEADLRSAHEMFCLGFDVFFKGNTLGSPKISTYAKRY